MDRAAHLRTQSESLQELRRAKNARTTLVWRRRSLVLSEPTPSAYWLDRDTAQAFEDVGPWVFLGMEDGNPHFAIDISSHENPKPLVAPGHFRNLHAAGIGMSKSDFAVLGYAQGILGFHKRTPHCSKCGDVLRKVEAGFARECRGCGTKVFPRTDPAVMMLITHQDKCLLARQHGFPPGMFSALAGFVEPGESLEECVRREAQEEVGLSVDHLQYFSSQAWPFPQSLMVAFTAEASDDRVVLEQEELEESRWVTREELRNPSDFFIPPPYSLAHPLIRHFVDQQ